MPLGALWHIGANGVTRVGPLAKWSDCGGGVLSSLLPLFGPVVHESFALVAPACLANGDVGKAIMLYVTLCGTRIVPDCCAQCMLLPLLTMLR